MGQKRWRPGIRPQLTIIVLLAAVLSTVATLFVTENAVLNYVTQQARAQQQQHMKIATLVLDTSFGQNLSISSDNLMVADSPAISGDFKTLGNGNSYGRYQLNGDTDYVDLVQQLIGGMVSVYQCADKDGNPITPCQRISSTFRTGTAFNAPRAVGKSADNLSATVAKNMQLSANPQEWVGVDTIDGQQYFADYAPVLNPQKQVIGVIVVAELLSDVTSVVATTTIELVIIGTIIMVAGVVLALFVASTIVGTLQRAARQVGSASERFGAIASQQASGSSQQVWAINAINQALQSLSETATDISRRTDQLAQMGDQVLRRRSEISPTQIDSIIAYITRSVRDISVASNQQAATYQRMTGAMQAVMEVAEQVAGDSQQTSENANRLENVVQQLRQLVGVRRSGAAAASNGHNGQNGATQENKRRGTVEAVRPMRARASGKLPAVGREMVGVGAMTGTSLGPGTDGLGSGGLLGARRGARPGSEGNLGSMGNMGNMGGPYGGSGMNFGAPDPMGGTGTTWGGAGGQPFGGMDPSGFGGRGGFGGPMNGGQMSGGQMSGAPMNGPLAGAAPGGMGGWNMPGGNSGGNGNWNFGGPPSLPGMTGMGGMSGMPGAGQMDFGGAGGRPALPPLGNSANGHDGGDPGFPWMQRDE